MLYMAQLEEKIKMEIDAREDLQSTYERSLNTGVTQFNRETSELAENPLVREISLAVAKQLLQSGKGGPPSKMDDLQKYSSGDQAQMAGVSFDRE